MGEEKWAGARASEEQKRPGIREQKRVEAIKKSERGAQLRQKKRKCGRYGVESRLMAPLKATVREKKEIERETLGPKGTGSNSGQKSRSKVYHIYVWGRKTCRGRWKDDIEEEGGENP